MAAVSSVPEFCFPRWAEYVDRCSGEIYASVICHGIFCVGCKIVCVVELVDGKLRELDIEDVRLCS